MLKKKMIFAVALTTLAAFSGCGSSNDASGTEDGSSSGSVASSVGGAYNASSTSGTQARLEHANRMEELLASLSPISKAYASTSCPTFSTAACGTTQTYSSCSFGGSSATWSGGVSYACSGSNVTRTFTNPTTRTNSFGSVVTVKSSGTAFTGTSYSGGTTFSPSSLNIAGTELTGVSSAGTETFDHVITTSTPLTVSGGVVNGTVTVFHNLAKVIGTAKLTNVTFTSGCCTPTSGNITTTFVADGVHTARSGFSGATESLVFTGCGSATYTGPEGNTGSVTLANCI